MRTVSEKYANSLKYYNYGCYRFLFDYRADRFLIVCDYSIVYRKQSEEYSAKWDRGLNVINIIVIGYCTNMRNIDMS